MRGRKGRVGGIFLGGFGLALGLLMLYSLLFEGFAGRATAGAGGEVNVSVFFLERSEWRIFARGVKAYLEGGDALGRILAEDDDMLLVETPRAHRRLRLTWRAVRGEGQTRDEVDRLLASSSPPVAVVGSSNTLLTAALAGRLRDDAQGRPGGGPLLLIPWATSMALLDLYPGRTFRFCSNNRREAELIVDCLKAQPKCLGPRRVVVVADRLDPYSIDLAACFRQAIAASFPKAEIVDAPDGVSTTARPSLSGRSASPTAAEQRRAKAIWRDVSEGPGGETWIVLPLLNEPARRMLLALNGAAPGRHDALARPVSALCGDAVGPTTLASFANQLVFPVWSVTTAGGLSGDRALGEDVQEHAEIVATLMTGLDRPGRPPTPDALRETLIHPTSPEQGPPAPLGRPLIFGATGERESLESGEVIHLRPDSPRLLVYPARRWHAPTPRDGLEGSP